jgi:transcriptional regulator with XRE-family HTH domain
MIATRNKRTPSIPSPLVARKRRFRAALGFAGMSMRDFAKAEGVSISHVSQVLSGKRESRTMDEKIAAFTEKHLRQVA